MLRAGGHVYVAGARGAMPLAVRAAVDAVAAGDSDDRDPAPGPGLAADRFHTECW